MDYKGIIRISFIYVASIIGAGFASGQEIVQFFTKYYQKGFYGIVLAGLIFAFLGGFVFDRVYKLRIKNFDEFAVPVFGWLPSIIIDFTGMIFMLIIFSVMSAGSGNVLKECLGLPYMVGVVIMTVISLIVILNNIKGVMKISLFLTPVMLFGIILAGIYIIAFEDVTTFSIGKMAIKTTDNWVFSAMLYVGYNSITSIVLMCSLGSYIKERKTAILGGVFGGLFLCMIAIILNCSIYLFYPGIMPSELPVMSILDKYGNILRGVYAVILLMAMFISSVTSGFCLIERLKVVVPVKPYLLGVIIGISVILFSKIGFSNMIADVYPLFGYVGLFIIFAVFLEFLSNAIELCLRKFRL